MNSSTPSQPLEAVWVFNGSGSHFPSGVFTTAEKAEAWILKRSLSGTLTLYHVDEGAYDWSIRNALFTQHANQRDMAPTRTAAMDWASVPGPPTSTT